MSLSAIVSLFVVHFVRVEFQRVVLFFEANVAISDLLRKSTFTNLAFIQIAPTYLSGQHFFYIQKSLLAGIGILLVFLPILYPRFVADHFDSIGEGLADAVDEVALLLDGESEVLC